MGKTDSLTCKEIIMALDNNKGKVSGPRCFFVNELGKFCHRGDKKAEARLRKVLQDEKEGVNEKFAAFCYLSETKNIEPETRRILEIFKLEPKNAELVRRAKVFVIVANVSLN